MAGRARPAQHEPVEPVQRQPPVDIDRRIQERALLMAIARTASLHARLRRFARDRDGVSAVEFAIILPFMLTLYLGGVELGDGLAIKFKTTLAARTVTDLASQYVSINGTSMQNILGAASTVLQPYSTSGVVVTLTELTVNSSGKGVVQWSC